MNLDARAPTIKRTTPGSPALRTRWRLARSMFPIALALLAAPVIAQEHRAHQLGEVEFLASATGVLIAAPHGLYDTNTAALAVEAARQLGAGYVVARGFRVDGVRINVNRPTEGANITSCRREFQSARAKEVYDLYLQAVSAASGGRPLRLYVEIHGNADPRTAKKVEIASTGISRAQARSLKDAYPDILVRAQKITPAFAQLELLVEPLDQVYFNAGCAKQVGILYTNLVPHGIHFEFPRSARESESRDATVLLIVEVVRKFLAEM